MAYDLGTYQNPIFEQQERFRSLASDARRSLGLTQDQLNSTLALNKSTTQYLQDSYRPAEDTSGASIQYLEDVLLQERNQYQESLSLMNERINSLDELAAEQVRMAEALRTARIPAPEKTAGAGIYGDLRTVASSRPVLADLVSIDPAARYR